MSENTFEPMDFERNSVGVLVVRVIRLKDIVKALSCTEDFARDVVKEIRGETSADGSTAFVLPSQLAAWAYQRAGKPAAPFPFKTVLVKGAREPADALKRAIGRAEKTPGEPVSSGTAVRQIRAQLEELKAGLTVLPGAIAVTVEQAAQRLGCGRTRVFGLLRAGKLTPMKKTGRRTMVTLASIEQWLLDAENGTEPRQPKTPQSRKRSGRVADAILRLPV